MAANNLGTAYIKIAPQMEGIQSAISSQLQKATSSAKISASSIAVGSVISKGISTTFNAISNSLDKAISRVDTLNVFPKIMKNLGFSAEESTSSINKLSDRIEGLPTTLDEIVTYTQRLASSTGNLNKGMKNATSIAIAFNDAALAGGKGQEEANRAFEQFVQVVSRGRPTMQDWKIMLEVMPGQLKQLAKYMGENNDSFKEYAKTAKKTVDQLDGMDLYEWISADKSKNAKERLDMFTTALVELDEKGGSGITSFKDQVGDATKTIGNAMRLIPIRIAKAMAKVIEAFGQGDIYTAVDKFTSSFSGIGDWIAKNVVPVIKSTIIPALKNLLTAVKNVFEFIAKHKDIQQILMGIANALVALKIAKTVGAGLSAVTTGIKGIVGAATNGAKGIKAFAEAMHGGLNLGESFEYAALSTKGLTKNVAELGAKATTTANSISAIGMAGIALGTVTLAALEFKAGLIMLETASIKAKTAAREYARSCDNVNTAVRNLNVALGLQKGILQDLKDALAAQDSAELEYLEAKKTAAEYQKAYNDLLKSGKASTDDLREAELKAKAATEAMTEAEKKFTNAKKGTTAADAAYFSHQVVGINQTNHMITQQEIIAGKYATVASQIDNLAKSTITYKDANGNLATATKQQTQEVADWTAQQLTKASTTWKQIYDLSVSEGISLTEACARVGKTSSERMVNEFTMGVTAYTPLATNAAETTVESAKNAMEAKAKEAQGTGKNLVDNYSKGILNTTPSATDLSGKVVGQSITQMKNTAKGSEEVGTQMVNGASAGVEKAKLNFVQKAANAIREAIAKMKKEAEVHSPSKKTAEIGKYLSLGLAKGIDDYADEAVSAAESATEAALGAFNGGDGFGINSASATPYSASGGLVGGNSVTQYNTFNQVDTNLDMNEISKRLGWQVSVAL